MNTENTQEEASAAADKTRIEQIRIDPKYKLELVASQSGGTRPCLEVVRINHSKRFGNVAVATQGRSMAIVPIGGDCVTEKREVYPYNISQDALKASRKVGSSKFSILNGSMSLNGDIKLGDNRSFPLPDSDINYPNWEQVLPSEKAKFTVALDAKLLLNLAKALGSEGGVTLRFIDEFSPITVTPNRNTNGELGVLMPMRVGG